MGNQPLYQVEISGRAAKSINRLPARVQERILQAVDELMTNPRPNGYIKLKGEDDYRIRIGDYRVIYSIEDSKLYILVIEVAHRKDIYRRR